MGRNIEESLMGIPLFGKKTGLHNIESIQTVLNLRYGLQNYLNQSTIIHVTGTNGKGSVSRMLSGIYTAAGYKVGLFTSPHMDTITERIRINNDPVCDELFREAYQAVKNIIEEIGRNQDTDSAFEPTFFEWLFAMSLYVFVQQQPEIIIVEVGIGGRLDTTNALKKTDLSVFTPIGMDHQGILGDTIGQIAREKAGILRHYGRAVYFDTSDEVSAIIEEMSIKLSVKSEKVEKESYKITNLTDKGIDFSIVNKYYKYESLYISTPALYQCENASVALACIHSLEHQRPVPFRAVQTGLREFYWPGRCEWIRPQILLDGAHNILGATELAKILKTHYNENSLDILIAMKEGKDYKKVIRILLDTHCIRDIYCADLSIQKGVAKEELFSTIQEIHTDKRHQQMSHPVTLVDDLREFIIKRIKYSGDRAILITGSLFLMSEIRKIIKEED